MRRKYHTKWFIGTNVLAGSLGLYVIAAVFIFIFPGVSQAQRKCGAEGQRPCKIWERIPSCNRGLTEDFRLRMCVGPKTQVSADTGKYIPRDTRKMTYVNLCNRSSRPVIYASIAEWYDEQYGWVTRGWWQVAAGKCAKVDIDLDYSGSVYVYGSANDGTEWDSEDAKFCVKEYDAFEVDNADKLVCPTRDFTVVGMAKFDVKPGNNNFNFGN